MKRLPSHPYGADFRLTEPAFLGCDMVYVFAIKLSLVRGAREDSHGLDDGEPTPFCFLPPFLYPVPVTTP